MVEIDELRTSIDGWQHDETSKLEARRMAIRIADTQLRSGNDVIVPQYLGRTDFIKELERTAAAASAAFIEIHLRADEDDVVARFDARRAEAVGGAHPEQDVDNVRSAVADAISRLEVILRERPAVLTIAVHQDLDVTLSELTEILEL